MASPIGSPPVNGIEGSGSGFRHQMPQIAVMARNPKIAQSKAAIKTDIMSTEKSTMDVEGVGKVVHIGSDMSVVDDSPQKKLLEELESNLPEESAVSEAETPSKPGSMTEDPVANNNETQDTKESMEVEISGQSKDEVVSEKAEVKNDEQSGIKPVTKRGRPRSSAKTPVSEPAKSKKVSRKSIDKSAAEVEKHSDESLTDQGEMGSPGKRQRKPKKLDLEQAEGPKPAKSPKDKPAKPKVEPTPEMESKLPVVWQVGDLVWSKVSGHPWWPCMVSYDPYTAQHTRIHNHRKSREYHVQFFGNAAERAWISTNNLLEFKGQAQFDEYVETIYKDAKSKKDLKKLKGWYGVPPAKANAVNIGVDQAETALPMSRNERKSTFTFVYKLPKSGKGKNDSSPSKAATGIEEDVKIIKNAASGGNAGENTPSTGKKDSTKKRKHADVSTPNSSKPTTKRRKIETQEESTPTKAVKKTPTTRPVSGIEASFDVFCQKERDSVMGEHPDFSEDMLLDYCRQQWCMMSKKQKARYKSKYSSEESDLSQQLSPSRKRRPSKKVIEAEEGNKALDEVLSGKKNQPDPPSSGKKPATPAQENRLKRSRKSTSLDEESKANSSSAKKIKKKVSKDSGEPQVKKEKDIPQEDVSDVDQAPSKPSTLIPAKKARPRKSVSVDGENSDKQSDSGRSTTPSPIPESIPVKKEKEEFQYEMEIYKLSTSGPPKKENLCQICDETGDLLECQGPCQGFFHIDCLGLSVAPTEGSFKCDECTNGVHSCFACKKADATTQRCSVPVCGKFYHVECLKGFPQAKVEGKGITCPLHNCHTCLANNLKGSLGKTNGRLLRCVQCPTAYHVGDFCMAAGSINLAGFNILCARHFQPIPSQKHHTHVNVSWCFNCNKGGTLLCCESCPAAFHAECLGIEFPTGSWYCPDCVKGKRPLYGEIIWVKLGNYRWWPGEICHPRNVPLNIQEKPHQVGEFPVHFLGSHDYFWLHQGRVFSFQDGDKGNSHTMSSKELGKQFSKGLQEASEAYKVWKEFKDNKEQIELEKVLKKPAPFKMVKTNIPLGSVTIKKADLSELPKCDCKPEQETACSMTSDCLNYMMMYECHPALCPAGEKCHNQFFTKRQYPEQKPQKTEGRGWGLVAFQDIKKGQFVNEYVGDLIDEEECKRRLQKAHETDVHNFYMMTLDMDRIIDAGPKGNLSRFMNHSCDPNLETQKWNVNGDVRVGLFALRDITSGEELTFNYNFDCLGNEQTKCCCGSKNCSGYLGVRPKTQAAALAESKKKEAKLNKLKKKKKVNVKRKHEDDCFRCGEGGELVMCDRGSCPKSYHLRCLSLDKPPHGKWDCPWHHCDECGKPAVQKCVECPNSFCTSHAESNTKIFDTKTYCTEHEELLETLAESQSQNSTTSDEVSDCPSDQDSKEGKPNTDVKVEKKEKSAKVKKDETLPPKKRGSKSLSQGEINGKSAAGGKGQKSKKSAVKGAGVTKGPLSDEALAVAPMFDDSEEEEFNLVIDIPNF